MHGRLAFPRRIALILLALVGLVGMACSASPSIVVALPTATASATPAFHILSSDGSEFAFISDINNISANCAVIDALSDPTMLVQATHFWGVTILGQPVSGTTHDHAIGVRYANGHWAICNEDQTPMPAGIRFVVKVSGPGFDHYGQFALLQTATASNTQSDYTVIDDPHTNGIGNLRLFVTANITPGGGGGIYNNHPIGVLYIQGKWAVFNEDQTPLPAGAAFNVMVDQPGGALPIVVHQATTTNTAAYATEVSEQSYTGWEGAFLTQVWVTGKPGAIGGLALGVYTPHHVGVLFTSQQTWSIFNEDHATMPIGATFNVGVL
jgi:hypothetical protein